MTSKELLWPLSGMLFISAGSLCLVAKAYCDHTLQRLKRNLDSRKIPYETWPQTERARTVIDLLEWLQTGEAALRDSPDGRLTAIINVAIVTAARDGDDHELILREFRPNGCNIPIERPVDGSMGTRIRQKTEQPIDAAQRVLGEKLGETQHLFKNCSNYTLTQVDEATIEEYPVTTFPGIRVLYHKRYFKVRLAAHNSDGLFCRHYDVARSDRNGKQKNSVFYWRPSTDYR